MIQIGTNNQVHQATWRAGSCFRTGVPFTSWLWRWDKYLGVPICLVCRELLENGGFIYVPAVKVRARGKAAGLSASVKAGVMGAAVGKPAVHFGRCRAAVMH